MTDDYRSFIQFHHNGPEHGPECGSAWHSSLNNHPHQRKFMQLQGRWIAEGDVKDSGELWAWGEWEAESKLLRHLDQSGDKQLPSRLWRPHYIPKDAYHNLHNTDPFIFGRRFLYSNCKQTGAMKHLGPGAVIIFGSHRDEWVLDTVLVISSHVKYKASEARSVLADCAPEAFVHVTAGPIADNFKGKDWEGKLYEGATPDHRVDGMFSFFPAMPANGEVGFKRPAVRLPSQYFDETQTRREYGRRSNLTIGQIRELWDSLVSQVREAGLVLGTHAALPERREA